MSLRLIPPQRHHYPDIASQTSAFKIKHMELLSYEIKRSFCEELGKMGQNTGSLLNYSQAPIAKKDVGIIRKIVTKFNLLAGKIIRRL
jgi:hypothetical protein